MKHIYLRVLISFLFVTAAVVILPNCTPKTALPRKTLAVNTPVLYTVETVTAVQAYTLVQANKNNLDFVILDVRTQDEFANGHIPGSINIDFLSGNFEKEINVLDRNKIYLVYCRTGDRSKRAAEFMVKLYFRKVYNLSGGVNDWAKQGYPLIN